MTTMRGDVLPDAPPLFSPYDDFQRIDPSSEQLADRYVFGFRSADSRARPFKLLRTQLAKRCADDNLKIIGVTSSSPNVGKTFITANVAAALSRLPETEVCVVDLDLHRPALARRFGMEKGNGIHDYLSGDVPDIHQIARRVNGESLILIPGFRRDVATGELLTSPRGDAFFAGLRALPKSMIVLVDMPPIFADDDAVIISNRIDGYLLVVEDGKTTRRQVRDTIRLMQPTPMIGPILNRYRHQLFNDEYGYGVSYGYGAYY